MYYYFKAVVQFMQFLEKLVDFEIYKLEHINDHC
jgi:hypothetical protein